MMRYWEMELDVCTPLFIGSGEKITKLDYVYQSSNWMVYMLDEAKWASFLKRARLMNDFTSKVEAFHVILTSEIMGNLQHACIHPT